MNTAGKRERRRRKSSGRHKSQAGERRLSGPYLEMRGSKTEPTGKDERSRSLETATSPARPGKRGKGTSDNQQTQPTSMLNTVLPLDWLFSAGEPDPPSSPKCLTRGTDQDSANETHPQASSSTEGVVSGESQETRTLLVDGDANAESSGGAIPKRRPPVPVATLATATDEPSNHHLLGDAEEEAAAGVDLANFDRLDLRERIVEILSSPTNEDCERELKELKRELEERKRSAEADTARELLAPLVKHTSLEASRRSSVTTAGDTLDSSRRSSRRSGLDDEARRERRRRRR
jgi:hypothetical protein